MKKQKQTIKPRNPNALNPLMKKGSAHKDKRKLSRSQEKRIAVQRSRDES